MINLGIIGSQGKVGRLIKREIEDKNLECQEVDKVNILEIKGKSDVHNLQKVCSNSDVIIDFSNINLSRTMLAAIKDLGEGYKVPKIVIGTTGWNTEDKTELLDPVSEMTSLLVASNFSLGARLQSKLAKYAAKVLKNEYDIEIIEMHHKDKLDAPSGTALSLAGDIADEMGRERDVINMRGKGFQKRESGEICISSVRAGGVVGMHNVLFADEDEIIEIKHTVLKREVFARRAIKAAFHLLNQPNGFYSLEDLFL